MKNYTFVKIAGKEYPIKFGMNALRKYGIRTNTSLSDLDKLGENMMLNSALTLILCGLEDGFRKAKQEFILSIDDLADLIDEDNDAIQRCMSILTEQMGGNTKKVGKKNPSKKKR